MVFCLWYTENMEKKTQKSFVSGAVILGIAGLLCKIIGAFFRIPLYNLMGDGMAYYEAVFPFYNFLLVISSSGIPNAISRTVAEHVAVGDYDGAKRVFRKAQILLLGIGLTTMLAMFFLSGPLSTVVSTGEGTRFSFMALSPALLFVSVMCSYRGYLQGLQSMTGTAVSQLVEQIVKLIAGLALAAALLPYGTEYASMGTLIGTSLSELMALIIIMLIYVFKKRTIPAQALPAGHDQEAERHIIRNLVIIAIPITIGAAIMPITGIIDSSMIMPILLRTGFTYEAARMRFVAFRTNVATIINMPAVFTSALAMSLVPAIGAAKKREDMAEVRSIPLTGIKLAMVIGIPCAAGLFVLSTEVLDFLYDISTERLEIASMLLKIECVGVVFLSLVQTLTGIIQGIRKQWIPMFNLAIGAVVKVALMLSIMRIPSINIYGAAIATVCCYATAGLLDLFFLIHELRLSINIWDLFLKPLVSSLVMGVAVYACKCLLSTFCHSVTVITLISVICGIVVYAVLLVLFKAFNREDLARIPGGRKLERFFVRGK